MNWYRVTVEFRSVDSEGMDPFEWCKAMNSD